MDAEMMFVRGKEAADRGNIDYAITILLDVLREFPDHLNSRLVVRALTLQRFTAKGAGLLAKISGFFKGLGPFLLMHLTGNSKKIMNACERFLVNYPTNVYVLSKLGKASHKLGYHTAAVSTLEFARNRAPESIKVMRALAEAYVGNKEHQKAMQFYEEVMRRKPGDRAVGDRLREVAAAGHLAESQLERSGSYRDQIRDKEKAVQLEEEQHIVRTEDQMESAVARLQKQLQQNPNDEHLLVELGELYERTSKYDFAMQAYKKAFEQSKRFPIRQKMGDLHIKLLTAAEKKAKQAVEAHPENEGLKTRVEKARQARADFCIKEFELRRKQYPTDLSIAQQLGEYYFEKGDPESLQKAISQFQQAVNDARLSFHARHMLGLSFARDEKTRDMAIHQFEQALARLPTMESPRAREIQYDMARVHEEEGNKQEALEIYKQIFGVDAGYKDVLEKIRQLS